MTGVSVLLWLEFARRTCLTGVVLSDEPWEDSPIMCLFLLKKHELGDINLEMKCVLFPDQTA